MMYVLASIEADAELFDISIYVRRAQVPPAPPRTTSRRSPARRLSTAPSTRSSTCTVKPRLRTTLRGASKPCPGVREMLLSRVHHVVEIEIEMAGKLGGPI